MQVMRSKQEEFKQTVQEKIFQIEENFMKICLNEYSKAKAQLKEFFL